MFDDCPDGRFHHRVTLQALGPGPLRPELDSFARGVPLSALPSLSRFALELCLLPVVERSMEQRHSMFNLWLGGKRNTTRHDRVARQSDA